MSALMPEQEVIAREAVEKITSSNGVNRLYSIPVSEASAIISDAIASASELAVREFTNFHHNPIVAELNRQLQAHSEATALPIGKSGPPCCGKVESVKWNPFNGVEAQSEDKERQ